MKAGETRTEKVTKTSRGDWKEKRQGPGTSTSFHSLVPQPDCQPPSRGTPKGKAGGRVGIAPILSPKPRCTKICSAGILIVSSSGWATGQLPTGLK